MDILPIQNFTTIQGIQAASGLVFYQNYLYIIADDSTFLYQYELESKSLNKLQMFGDQSQENIEKKLKQDFALLLNQH